MTLALCLMARPSSAHEFWIAPTRYRPAHPDTVAVSVYAGTGFRGELKPYAPSRVVRFRLRTTRDLDLSRAARNGDLVMARFVVAEDGGALVSYESSFADIELPGPEFDAYLKLEGLDEVRAARGSSASAARERYARCAKTWIAGSDAKRVTAPAGMTYELTPLADPTTGAVTLRATFRGQPLSGALVVTSSWKRSPRARSWGDISVRALRTAVSPSSAPPGYAPIFPSGKNMFDCPEQSHTSPTSRFPILLGASCASVDVIVRSAGSSAAGIAGSDKLHRPRAPTETSAVASRRRTLIFAPGVAVPQIATFVSR